MTEEIKNKKVSVKKAEKKLTQSEVNDVPNTEKIKKTVAKKIETAGVKVVKNDVKKTQKTTSTSSTKSKTVKTAKNAPSVLESRSSAPYGTGKRKRSIAKVYIVKDSDKKGINIIVNGRDYKEYFSRLTFQQKLLLPIHTVEIKDISIIADVIGGGLNGQVDAVKLGISKAILELSGLYRALLSKKGLLTRDSRKVERKKPGLKKARKKEQFSKR